MIRVLLADDHAVVRTGFRLLLETATDVRVIAEADSGETCIARFDEHAPDVVVLDLSMPGIGGLEALKRLRGRSKDVRVLALSAHDDPMHARRALRQGALGFLSKRTAPETLLEGVRAVASGARYLDPKLAQDVALAEIDGGSSPVDQLSEREFDVFIRLAKGAAVQRIATELNLSTSTVGTHLYNIKLKLSATNQAELTLIALRAGLIEA
jgi:two-component system, NarL family, invasion response regulator UvrY